MNRYEFKKEEIIVGGKKSERYIAPFVIFDYAEDGSYELYRDVGSSIVWFNIYDRKGRILHSLSNENAEHIFEYNKSGKLIREKSGKFITLYEYNGKGRLIHKKTSSGDVFYKYNQKGQVIEEKFSNGDVITYEYNSKGQLVSEKRSNGIESHYKYNSKGLLVNKKIGSKEDGFDEIIYEYNSKGDLQYSKAGYRESYYKYLYWKNGRKKQKIEYIISKPKV